MKYGLNYKIDIPPFKGIIFSNAIEVEKKIARCEFWENIFLGFYLILCPFIGIGIILIILYFLAL